MKTQTFKLFTILALLLTTSCSVDNLQDDFERETLERETNAKPNSEIPKDAMPKGSDVDQQRAGNPSPTYNPNLIELNPIPFGADIVGMYLDMDQQEANYNGTYSGSFSLHFRNEMMTHFTIYSVETSSNPDCGNVELWIVNLDEYNDYMVSIGGTVIVKDVDTGGSGTSNTGSSGATIGGVDKNKKDPNEPDAEVGNNNNNNNDDVGDPDVEPDKGIPTYYFNSPYGIIAMVAHCFESDIID
ncbi:hypothetical protein [uncultured Psychroserpens sp.]|uniref:hypothetical protein n=1 Tax=uncultured Psychroserpens sp. TaxID=255436 RepID=UPI00261EDCCC|nr:hypothetical protein [uncultured Psychroserpens sp.]